MWLTRSGILQLPKPGDSAPCRAQIQWLIALSQHQIEPNWDVASAPASAFNPPLLPAAPPPPAPPAAAAAPLPVAAPALLAEPEEAEAEFFFEAEQDQAEPGQADEDEEVPEAKQSDSDLTEQLQEDFDEDDASPEAARAAAPSPALSSAASDEPAADFPVMQEHVEAEPADAKEILQPMPEPAGMPIATPPLLEDIDDEVENMDVDQPSPPLAAALATAAVNVDIDGSQGRHPAAGQQM